MAVVVGSLLESVCFGVFVAGDRTHPQDNVIYEMLDLIYYGVGMARYVPDQMNLASEVELMVNT